MKKWISNILLKLYTKLSGSAYIQLQNGGGYMTPRGINKILITMQGGGGGGSGSAPVPVIEEFGPDKPKRKKTKSKKRKASRK